MRKPLGEVEVLYVDSDSADDSIDRANRAGVRIIQLRPQRPCAALARNAGWKATTSEIVLFLDADTELAPDFAADSIGAFDNPRIAVVFGDRREGNPRASLFTRVLDLDWVHAPGTANVCGGDALMRRSALQEVNGFDESLIAGEEPEALLATPVSRMAGCPCGPDNDSARARYYSTLSVLAARDPNRLRLCRSVRTLSLHRISVMARRREAKPDQRGCNSSIDSE